MPPVVAPPERGRAAAALLNVRRLAAMDMYGTRGGPRRRWIIMAEFLVGTAGCLFLGIATLRHGSALLPDLLGIWLIGAGINYFPLWLHAIGLLQPGVLQQELTGIDVPSELRRYGVKQLWIAVPFLVAALAVYQWAAERPSRASGTE